MVARNVALPVVLWVLVLCFPLSGTAQVDGALRPVELFHSELLNIMRNGERLGFDGRKVRFGQLVERTFDQDFIARRLLRPHWQQFDRTSKRELKTLIFDFATSILAVQFDSYDNQRFETRFVRELKRGMARVRSDFHLDEDDPPIKVDFMLRPTGNEWRIVDFWFDGVSGSRIHHAEFNAIVSKGGKAALIKAINNKIDKMRDKRT